jgi:serine/threonine protein kinase
MPPISTATSLYHFYAIVTAAQALGISYESNANIVDRNHNQWNHIVRLDLREMATDHEGKLRFFNNYLINTISRARNSPYLDCFEGAQIASYTFHYLTSNRDMCFKDLLKNYRHEEVVANQIERLIFAVSHMHELGLVHRNLSPAVIFQSNEE